MRITFLTWRDSTHPDGGGSEVYVEQVARRLAARGHDVTLVCARHGSAPADEDLDGVRLVRTGGRLTVYPRGLARLLRRPRPDVVVDVINGLPFGTPLLRRRGVVALVHHVHQRQWQIIYPGAAGRFGWFVESRVTPRLYRRRPHLTVSEASRRDLVGLGVPAARVTVAPNGLTARRSPVARADVPRLVVLARLVPHKQVEHAVEVARRLQVPLDVVGDGWWREQVERDVAARGAEHLVTLHGHVSDADRDALLARAWLMLLPSVKEGWGLAVSEAAAQATPAIAYRWAGGVAESVLDGETGLLVEDLDEMAEATRRLLADRDELDRLGTAAQRRAGTFDWESTTDVVERVLLAEGQRSP